MSAAFSLGIDFGTTNTVVALAGETGAAGAGQEITSVVAAEARAAGEKHTDEGDGADKIVAFLESIKVL